MKKVLVVEDDRLIAKMYWRMLSGHYEVQLAYDGEAGLAAVASFEPDLVLLDLNMPKVSGRQVLMELQKQGVLKTLPVVVVSNEADALSQMKVKELGAWEYVTKADIELDQLMTLCKKYLGE